MLVALFSPASGWAGKSITWDDGTFTLEGHGPIKTKDVVAYDEQGQLEWPQDDIRDWVSRVAQHPEVVPGVRLLGSYGADAAYYDVTRQASPPGIAIAGFMLGIIGFIFPILIFWWIGLPLSLKGYRRAQSEGLPTGLALAGLIINAVMTGVSLLALIALVVIVVAVR